MTSTPTNTPPPEEEGLLAHIGRACKNATTKCFGIAQTSDEYAKIKYKVRTLYLIFNPSGPPLY
jgi:hypothetical protein